MSAGGYLLLVLFILPSLFKKAKQWRRDFGIAEVVTMSAMSVISLLFRNQDSSNVTVLAIISIAGDMAEYVLFLGTLAVQSMIRDGESVRTAFKRLFLLAPAELADVFMRPVIFGFVISSVGEITSGMIWGKIMADFCFYSFHYAVLHVCPKILALMNSVEILCGYLKNLVILVRNRISDIKTSVIGGWALPDFGGRIIQTA